MLLLHLELHSSVNKPIDMWPFKLNWNGLQLNIQCFGHTTYVSTAHQPHVATVLGSADYLTYPSSPKISVGCYNSRARGKPFLPLSCGPCVCWVVIPFFVGAFHHAVSGPPWSRSLRGAGRVGFLSPVADSPNPFQRARHVSQPFPLWSPCRLKFAIWGSKGHCQN